MVRTQALGALAVAFLVGGCETPLTPQMPFEFTIPTSEEFATGSGVLHILMRETISAAEDTTTALHINARGTGVGTISGARYGFHDVFRVHTHQGSAFPQIVGFTDVLHRSALPAGGGNG